MAVSASEVLLLVVHASAVSGLLGLVVPLLAVPGMVQLEWDTTQAT